MAVKSGNQIVKIISLSESTIELDRYSEVKYPKPLTFVGLY